MAKVSAEKKYVTFVKGLITEANALTYPENASLDEDNFDLNIDGSRYRRLGVDYEDGYVSTPTGIATSVLAGSRKSFHRWDFPGGATDVTIGIVRAYNQLWFVNLLDAAPSSALLNGGAPLIISGMANSDIEIATVNNFAVVVCDSLTYPVLLSYNSTTKLVSQEILPIQVRDTWGVEDGLGIKERPISLTDQHRYNLSNQGWSDSISSICSAGVVADANPARVWGAVGTIWELFGGVTPTTPATALQCTFSTLGVYPSNSDIWTLGKVGSSTSVNFEKYDPNSMVKNSIDNTEAPKGRFVIDAFQRGYSRQLLTGLSTLPIDREVGRPTTVCSYAGRLVFAGISSSIVGRDSFSPNYSGYIFFSQVIDAKDKLGKCYQEADPTSPTDSALVDTDGGVIHLPEISRIIRLVAARDSLIVFADNGIWEIFGDTGGFKATSFQIAKISSMGISNHRSVVVAGNSVIYWAKAGIFIMNPNPQTGRYETQNISLSTIQTYYDGISDLAKNNARGFYDERTNTIRWMYNDTVDYALNTNLNNYNRILNLSLSLQAFYKFSIQPLAVNSPYICDFVEIPSFALKTTAIDVYVGNDAVLIPTNIQVQSTTVEAAVRSSKYNFLVFTNESFTLGKFANTSFMDWKTADGVGVNYSSYLITGYEVFADVMRNKQVPYIFFHFKRTENGFVVDNNGNLTPKNPSSCLVQAQWNWSNSDAQGKWGTQFQAYRYLRPYTPVDINDTYDTGDSLIVTKNKFRGSGRSISLKLQSEQGKDIKLLGWAIIVTGDSTP